jgi:hypothetical protein
VVLDKERKQVAIRGKSALNSINICVARAPMTGQVPLHCLRSYLRSDSLVAVYGRLRSGWTDGLFTQRVTHRGAGIEYRFLLVVHLPAGPLVTK